MVRVYVGVGSNVERENNIRGGLHALAERFGKLELSPIYQNTAVGFEGDDFYNLVAAFITHKEIDEVAAELKEIEYDFGRRRNETRFSPRTLDIDLLMYGDTVDSSHDVPREDITKYAFVLKPLFDMEPDLVHPQTGKTIAELWQEFPGEDAELQEVRLENA
ncbi:MAG: 2-amino-4-hydroxy-6-hydroxymethyldihydropteridine diphosphokinase [Gammaproteobacteria bacterium]